MGRSTVAISVAVLLAGCWASASLGQSSASYELSDHTFNAGGHPHQATIMVSTSYRITLDALGDGVVGAGLVGDSYRMDGSFGASYPPPGEVRDLTFVDKQSLAWGPDRAAGDYNLYRDSMSVLSGLGYGLCLQQELPVAAATDGETPTSGTGFFYLVTVENLLDEEGPKGVDSHGDRRQGNVCP
jgi:hypothetical protein